MKLDQWVWTADNGWKSLRKDSDGKVQLVLAFGARVALEESQRFLELKAMYPEAQIISASTAGEIVGDIVQDDSISAVAMHFEKTPIRTASIHIDESENSYEAGKRLVGQFEQHDLTHLFVLSDGQHVNGTDLVRGMHEACKADAAITGGLAGDGTQFQRTLVGLNEPPKSGTIAAVAFYGKAIQVGYGSKGGWDSFGPERLITKATANVLYELDGNSALELYKKYLGDKAQELPGSALLFPLAIKTDTSKEPLVRTILAIDEQAQSMTFAGNMPVGAKAQLMKANFDRIIDGAAGAAEKCRPSISNQAPDVAILISCIGRKLILGMRVDEEVESVMETLGGNPVVTGFYSYGEIAPFMSEVKCELHNQTMTITTLKEFV